MAQANNKNVSMVAYITSNCETVEEAEQLRENIVKYLRDIVDTSVNFGYKVSVSIHEGAFHE